MAGCSGVLVNYLLGARTEKGSNSIWTAIRRESPRLWLPRKMGLHGDSESERGQIGYEICMRFSFGL